jgi:hypothetical protein
MESSTFNFVEPGKPGGNYGEMMKEERKGASSKDAFMCTFRHFQL